MITRRCTQRQFLLRPDRQATNTFIYCLGVASQRHKVDLINVMQMSNHLHDAIYDREGNGPAFYETFHGLLARSMNALRGRCENFFSSAQTGVLSIETVEDLIERIVYIATNPVKAGLVARVEDWPGASGLHALLTNEPLRATRPAHFFSADGDMPEEVTVHMTLPPGFGDRQAILDEVAKRVAQYERDKAAERARTNRRVLGRYKVINQDWSAAPTTREERRKPKRTIGARNRHTLFKVLDRRQVFASDYRKARVALLAGAPIPFPFGTYWLRRFAGVEIAIPQFLN